jgi:cell volume regulation protein A
MAIVLTTVATQAIATGTDINIMMSVLLFLWKFVSGPVIGFFLAKLVIKFINKLSPNETGYYQIIMFSSVMFIFGIAELVQASGILAIFTAGIVMGNKHFVHKQGVLNFSSSFSTISNIMLFILLAVLVQPGTWFSIDFLIKGILLFAVLTFIARPLAVFLGTIGTKLTTTNKIFMTWAGLRGAVPIVLATFPAVAGIEAGIEIFNLVFFAVLLSLLFQGSTLGKAAKLLKITTEMHPTPPYSLDFLTKTDMADGQKMNVFSVTLPEHKRSASLAVKDIALPDNALFLMIARREKIVKRRLKIFRSNKHTETDEYTWNIISPRGDTILQGWDHITVLSSIDDEENIINSLISLFEEQ